MKYLKLERPVTVHGRLVYPEDGVLMLDDDAIATHLVVSGAALDVTPEFEAAIAEQAAQAAAAAAAESAPAADSNPAA